MRFFHLSDLHIGKHLHLYNMAKDQAYILDQIIEKAKEYRPDAIIIAGDIYDKSVPSAEAYQLFDQFLNGLAQIEPMIPVLIIAGNHDSAERLQFASSFLKKHQIYISVLPPQSEEEHLQCITLQDEWGEVNFYLFPFTKPGYVRPLFAEGEITDYQSAFAKILEREQIDYTKRNVLVAHQFFVNQGKEPETCDSEIGTINIGGLDAIDISVISGFDYVALGHIHGPQTFQGGRVRYCGTPLKYSVSEEFHKKSISLVTVTEKAAEPEITCIPLVPLHDVRRIKGTMQEIIEEAQKEETNHIANQEDTQISLMDFLENNTQHVHDYVSISLTDEKELYRPKDSLAEVYDHILEVTMDNSRTRALHDQLYADFSEERMQTPMESFCDFYQMMQQQPISEEETQVIAEILENIGGGLA